MVTFHVALALVSLPSLYRPPSAGSESHTMVSLACSALLCCSLYSILVLLPSTSAINITVDDTDTRISYTPSTLWSQGSDCSSCDIKLDPNQTFGGTWHDTTYTPGEGGRSFQFKFFGVAVYVFNILLGSDNIPAANMTITTNLIFMLDGVVQPHGFNSTSATFSKTIYKRPVFGIEDLENTNHTLTVQAAGQPKSVILFDFLIYTEADITSAAQVSTVAVSNHPVSSSSPGNTPSSAPSASTSLASTPSTSPSLRRGSHAQPGTIVGGVIGAVGSLIILASLAFCVRRRAQRRVLTISFVEKHCDMRFGLLHRMRTDKREVSMNTSPRLSLSSSRGVPVGDNVAVDENDTSIAVPSPHERPSSIPSASSMDTVQPSSSLFSDEVIGTTHGHAFKSKGPPPPAPPSTPPLEVMQAERTFLPISSGTALVHPHRTQEQVQEDTEMDVSAVVAIDTIGGSTERALLRTMERLVGEVTRLREQQEMHIMCGREAPPEYGLA